MNINKATLPLGIWYEDDEGNILPWNVENIEPPEGAKSKHICFPLEIREQVYFNKDSCKPDVTWSTHIGRGNEDVIIAMVNSGDYSLSEALALYASCCERCANVLIYKYLGGKDGYAEYSVEWKKANTVCRYCREEAIK